jgi:hypothetical protein
MSDMSKIGKSNVRRGKTLERRVAKLFTEWTGSNFRRRRVEGRDSTTIERDSTADVISVSRSSIFSIEVKNAAGFSMDSLLANYATNKLTLWWHQSTYDAKLMTDTLGVKIYPFLFFKPIRSWDWVVFPTELIENGVIKPSDIECGSQNNCIWFPALRYDYYSLSAEVSADVSQSKKHPNMVSLRLPSVFISRWSDFCHSINPESIFYPSDL